MTADLEFAVPLGLMPPPTDAPPHGRVVELTPKPTLPILPVPSAASSQADEAADVTARWLIGGACVLLAGLALAMGVTSFHAQFAYIFATKRQWAPAVLEALGLDAGAVIFSLLGIALARLGRRAAVERGLVVICALGSCGMNVLNANLGSPRSVAVYAMPPVLFALTSDRLIAVIRRAALSRTADAAGQQSAWRLAGRSLLYGMRFAVDRRGTVRGLRQAILAATPLPEISAPRADDKPADHLQLILDALRRIEQSGEPQRPRSRPHFSRTTKTARFLSLVQEKHGPLADFPLTDVYRVSAELAPKAGLHDGSARTALRAAVLTAQGGAR